ncbi:MAG: DUF501 domain-containing protein [Actinomycetota bacterium]|nr:DUF501 domain-containing protein [Actinomycetota bacterium]MCL6092389.1 DUF501 domain-containing protein [Actinomycetota bacterium]MDA8166278.1 DUF501 domain-containing protein [Actinomycetota bacterium]
MPEGPTPLQLRLAVAGQLGRPPAIEFEIVVSCRYGWPAVIKNSSVDAGGNPNPNLYYLSCPYLRREISRLEDRGEITRLQERLTADAALAESVRAAQRRHEAEWEAEAGGPIKPAPPGPRIAAASGDLLLKCLHAQFAYYLVHRDYAIGGLIAGELADIWCGDERCRHYLREPEK